MTATLRPDFQGPHFGLAALSVILATLLAAGCFNDGFTNSGTIGGGGRFALVIEPARTSIEGTHFLVDTATGDLWRLDENADVAQRWLRISDAPADVTELDQPHFAAGGPRED